MAILIKTNVIFPLLLIAHQLLPRNMMALAKRLLLLVLEVVQENVSTHVREVMDPAKLKQNGRPLEAQLNGLREHVFPSLLEENAVASQMYVRLVAQLAEAAQEAIPLHAGHPEPDLVVAKAARILLLHPNPKSQSVKSNVNMMEVAKLNPCGQREMGAGDGLRDLASLRILEEPAQPYLIHVMLATGHVEARQDKVSQ